MSDRPARAQLVLLGGTGGFALQTLFPALARLAEAEEDLASELQVVAAGLGAERDAAFRERLVQYIPTSARRGYSRIAPRILRRSVDVRDGRSLAALAADLEKAVGGAQAPRLYYFALPPELFESAVTQLAQAGQLSCEGPHHVWRRLLVEKPLGRDLESALTLNHRLRSTLREEEIFRVAGAVAPETMQDLLEFRFQKSEFEPFWSREHIEAVQIMIAREEGVQIGQGMHFDRVGALREGIQNAALPLLALVAMKRPSSLEANSIRCERARALEALRLPSTHRRAADCVRAQYAAGNLGGARMPGYRAEDGIDYRSGTETYVAVRVRIDAPRWRGVPFVLRYGMRLAKTVTEIVVYFRSKPRSDDFAGVLPPVIRLRLDPRLAVSHSPTETHSAVAAATQSEPSLRAPFDSRSDLCGALLLRALRGDPTGFPRSDEVDLAWRWGEALKSTWTDRGAPPLLEYRAGSWGPFEADRLLSGHGDHTSGG